MSLAGCAATLPPPPAPPVAAPAPPPPPPPDVTAVPTPENLVVFARLSNAATSVKVVTDWGHLPSLDPTTLVEGLLEGMTDTKDNAVLATVVDATQPIDFAASFQAKIPPKAFGAFAAALKSIDAAKSAVAATFDATPGDNGVIKLALRPGHKKSSAKSEDDDGEEAACELAPGAGAAPFRLVCGSSKDALSALAPYLTRTAPRESMPADLHLELRAGPIGGFTALGRMQAPKIISNILGLNAAGEPATADLLNAVLGDVLDYVADVDVMTLDATLDPEHAAIAVRTAFKSSTSFLARLATAHPERVDVPPAVFWRLPGDVDLASFGSGIDEADLQHPRELVVAAVDEQLGRTKLAEADRHALSDLVKEVFHASGSVVGHGMDGEASYWLIERTDASTRGDKIVRDVVAAFNRPGIVKWLRGVLPAEATLPTLKLGAQLAGLPKGSLHIEVTIPPEATPHAKDKGTTTAAVKPATPPPPRPAPEVFHIVVVPDGPRSWAGISSSTATLRARLASVTGASPAPDSLGQKPAPQGLEGFKDARMSGGGFITVRSFVELVRQSMHGRRAAKAARWDNLLHHLPSKGTTPIVMTAAPEAPTKDDPGGVHELHLNVPAAAIRDAVWFGLQVDGLTGN